VPAVDAGEHDALELELDEPAYGVAPGQTACLLAGDLVVGRATIA
jgi:tRNA-specific 2-thiouridylase